MENTEIIKVQHLAKNFGSFQAVKDVSFTVNKGDVFGFLGPNGAGKSTTIRCMLSLIKPDNGQIQLFGKDLKNHRNEILSKVGSIIEKPDFYRYLSAEKNLAIFARISGKDVSKREIAEMLDFVGLNGRNRDKVGGFSHGMKQRLGIAQTLLHQPDLIVLDEPTTGLDPQGIVEIRNLILRLKSEQNKTVILSSHQLSEIELISNRMVIINKGQSIIEGDVKELLNAQEMVVQLEVNDMEKTLNVLNLRFGSASFKQINERIIEVNIEKQLVPSLNQTLVQEGVEVHAMEPKRKLEDFFHENNSILMLLKNTYNEFIKILAKPRSYLGIGALTLLVLLILFAMKADGKSFISFVTASFEQTLSFNGNILNGNLIAFIILQMLIVHIPLLVSLVTGDLISGEAAMGTIRMMATKPISRTQIVLSKFIAGAVYTLILTLWLGFLALIVGKWIFGSGDLIVLNSDGLVILKEQDILWRYGLSFGVAYLALLTISTLSICLSAFAENSIGPIVSTMSIIILFTIIGTLDVSVFDSIKPFLFTTHMASWRSFFEDPVPWTTIRNSVSILVIHNIVLVLIAVYKFNKKDITS